MSQTLLNALDALEKGTAGKTVVCLPDLFIDHIVTMPKWGDTQKLFTSAVLRGGGNIRGMTQRLVAGGNAFNTARALAGLGVAVRFCALTSRSALDFLEHETRGESIDFSLVGTTGAASKTVAMELGAERVNVMLNDPGSLEGLRVSDLGADLPHALRSASAVHIANWGQNQSNGTPFVTEVLGMAKEGKALTFLDPSDVWGREKDVLEFIGKVAGGGQLDYLLVNESELREVARVLLLNAGGTSPCAHGDIDGQGTELSRRTKVAVGAHTQSRSQLFRKGKTEGLVETPVIAPTRTTGAGDAWNAGFIAGTLAGIAPTGVLELAAATARHFVTHAGLPPSPDDLRQAAKTSG